MTFLWKVTEWIDFVEDEVHFRVAVKAVMKLRVL